MKVKFLAAGVSPDYYTIDGDVITAHFEDGSFEDYDFSQVPAEEGVIQVQSDGNIQAVRKAEINSDMELEVTLCQKVGPGHWTESDWIDSTAYDPTARYVQFVEAKPFAGIPTYVTKDGIQVYGGEA